MDESITVRQWINVVRRARLGRTIKMVALALATYADPDGSRVHPGLARLSFECELSYTGVKGALRKLREAGLIKKVGRRGEADDYQLILHQDLLERVNVPTPSQAEKEINRIRQQWRGTYVPGLRSGSQTAESDDTEGLRSVDMTAESTETDPSAVTYTTADEESAVTFSTGLRSPTQTATYQDHTTTTTNHSGEDLRTDVAVDGGSPPNEDPISPPVDLASYPRCRHGRPKRRNRTGQPRCEKCRAEGEDDDASETITAASELGQSKCDAHKMPAHRCIFCRRGLPGATA